eukprot:g7252.t1
MSAITSNETTGSVKTTDNLKISQLIENELLKQNAKPFVSIEFYPPKKDVDIPKLFKALERLKAFNPLFADVTWGAGGSTSDLTMELCTKMKNEYNVVPNMHLTCTNVVGDKISKALTDAKENGITNILALRGDPPAGQDKWEATDLAFSCALDLIQYIRKEHGDYFHVTTAGYPEGHPNAMKVVTEEDGGLSSLSPSELKRYSTSKNKETGKEEILVCKDEDYKAELQYLKQKVDAGANCIITQMFFDVDVFLQFVDDCRAIGITVPILPGLMMIGNLGGFRRMTGFCKSRIPKELDEKLTAFEAMPADADLKAKVKAFGIEYCVDMCNKLIASKKVPGLHFYTLNMSSTTIAIVEKLGYVSNSIKTDEA